MPQRRSAGYSDPHGDSRRAGARSVPGSTPIGKRYLEDAETALLYSAALARGLALPAGVVKLVDTSDSKSDALKPCRFESGLRYQEICCEPHQLRQA
jgi:hypothetical protein